MLTQEVLHTKWGHYTYLLFSLLTHHFIEKLPPHHWLPWFYRVISCPSHPHSWRDEEPIRLFSLRIWAQNTDTLISWFWVPLHVTVDMGGLKSPILVLSPGCQNQIWAGHFVISQACWDRKSQPTERSVPNIVHLERRSWGAHVAGGRGQSFWGQGVNSNSAACQLCNLGNFI